MRLFVAIELPDDVKDRLGALQTVLPGAVWVQRPALHLTLRFLGDRIEPIRLTPIKLALSTIRADAFPLSLQGVGRFPSPVRRPARVLWVGLKDQPALTALHQTLENALAEADFPPEDRAFSPHITLARLKGSETPPQVTHFLDQQRGFRCDPFSVTSFHLFSSVLTPQGPQYTDEQRFPLH